MLKNLLNRLAPLTIVADWGDGTIHTHKAWSRAGALAWLACYPMEPVMLVRNRLGVVVAHRA